MKNVNTTNLINSFLMPKPLNDEDKNNVKIANIKRFLIIPTQKLHFVLLTNAGMDETQAGIKTARRKINNVRHADDTP